MVHPCIHGQEELEGLFSWLARTKEMGRPFRFSSADPGKRNRDYMIIKPRQELVLCDQEGEGLITHIWMTVDPGLQLDQAPKKVILRIYWDGELCPAVETPLGDFFGMGFGLRHDLWTLPVRVSAEGRAMNCFLPMPFKKGFKVTLENQGRKHILAYWNIDGRWRDLPDDTGYFHAVYRQEIPDKSGPEYEILYARGKGVYIGTFLCIQQIWPGWPGEGNDRFYVDGAARPTLEGTGLEDYFLDAWDFRTSNSPFYAIPLSTGEKVGSLHSALRWHICDPVYFEKEIMVTVEKLGRVYSGSGKLVGNGERHDNYSSVAYFYLDKPCMDGRIPIPVVSKRIFPVVYPEKRFLDGIIYEVEDISNVKPDGKVRVVQADPLLWGGGALVKWVPKASGSRFSLPLEGLLPGIYELEITVRRGRKGGMFSMAFGAGEKTTLDAYLDKKLVLCMPEVCFLGPCLLFRSRDAALNITCTGRNAFSRGRILEIDRVKLIRKGDIPPSMLPRKLPVKVSAFPKAVVPFSSEAMAIDGKLEEKAWKKSPALWLVNATTGLPVFQGRRTLVRLVADPKGLCLAFFCEDKDISTPYGRRDDPLWHADAVEVFIDANGNGKDYLEIEVSPKGVIFDAYFLAPRKKRLLSWNPLVEKAVTIDGTLNDPGDKDSMWTVEMRIPWSEIPDSGGKIPGSGEKWRMNLYRCDFSKGEFPSGQAWSVVPNGDYHSLARFGIIVFGREKRKPAEKKGGK